MSDKSDTIKKDKRKQMFLLELINNNCLGNVAVAAKRVGVARQMLYRWRKEDIKFATIWDQTKKEVDELLIEKAESALIGAIDAGNITAIIFTLKTRSPERWGDRQKKIENGRIEDVYEVSPEFSKAMGRFLAKA